jgi:hypothetical protein
VVLAALAGALGVTPATRIGPAAAQDAPDALVTCATADVPEVGPRACKSREAGTWLLANGCRRVEPLQEPVCPAIDGRAIHEAAMTAHESSWLHRALALQSQLDLDVPLAQALLPHTHNSANSTAYAPSVSSLDANQVLSLTDQLRLGMRAIEIDIHWVPHPSGDPAAGGRAVVQCHGEPVATPAGVLHAGCSIDTLLVDLLEEVDAWLHADGNEDEVLLLYLENALDGDPAAHDAAVAAIESTLGDLAARPATGAGCQSLPVHRSKQDLLDDDTRVLITGNCGPGGWTDWVFERGASWDERGGSSFDCAAERAELDFESTLVRRYEDSTWLSAMAGSGSHRDAPTMTAMVQCGVDLVGFDQVHAGDDRLASLVWSWRTDEPAMGIAGACAAQGADGRFFAAACDDARPVACRTATGAWAVTPAPAPWATGEAACRAVGHAGAGVPSNGWDSTLLRAAAGQAGAASVWLAYGQDATGAWTRGMPAAPPEPEPGAPGRSGDRPADPNGHGGPPTDPPGAGGPGRGQPVASTRPLPATSSLLGVALTAALCAGAVRRRRAIRRAASVSTV